jgi:plastocyanin
MRGLMQRAGLIVAVAAVIGACGGGGGTNNNGTITIAKNPAGSGDAQVALVATVLPQDLSVLVTEDGNPKQGQTISFTPTGGGVNPPSSVSDANGIAKTTWTLGTVSGAQTVTASLRAATGSPLTFTGTASPGPVKHITRGSGDGQIAAINTNFPLTVTVALTDTFGNAEAGINVTWVALSGSATFSEPGAVTDVNGISAQTVSAGATPGPVVIRATTSGLPAAVADFNLAIASTIKVVSASTTGGVSFTSASNSTSNPAVDTIPAGGAMHWALSNGTHSVLSTGAGVSGFTSSGTLTQVGYTLIFNTAGTFPYECGFHGPSMTGTVVVQ